MQTQTKAYNVFKAILPEENPYLKNAKDNLDIFLQLSVQFERAKTEKAKSIGVNKPTKEAQNMAKQRVTEEMMRQRERLN